MFETALAAAEDETDVVAAKIAKEEAVADLAEFDEAIPIDEQNDVKLSKADMEVQALEKQVVFLFILTKSKTYVYNYVLVCANAFCLCAYKKVNIVN